MDTCEVCGTAISLDDDQCICELSGKPEHIECCDGNGHAIEAWLAPLRKRLEASHAEWCIEVAMSGSPWDDDKRARDFAAQLLEDGQYQCVCGERGTSWT